MLETTLIQAEELRLGHSDGLVYGPLSFTLKAGQGALIEVDDLALLRRLMACCQGFERPDAGSLDWGLEIGPESDSRWDRYDFFRRIGYVDRNCQLLSALTLRQNLELYFGYARLEYGSDRSEQILAAFKMEPWADLRSDDLPEPIRRLALYVLALAKEPRLMLMERPRQFLDRDYELVWTWVQAAAAAGRLGYIVFDRKWSLYNSADFQQTLKFSPF